MRNPLGLMICVSMLATAMLGTSALISVASADGIKDAPRPVVRRIHNYAPDRHWSYPPTVIRDGRSYFYYPGTGRTDRLAEPCGGCEAYAYTYRRRFLWFR